MDALRDQVSPDTDNSSSRVDPFRLKEESENEGLALLAIEAENTPEEAETSGSETMIVDTWRGEGDSDGDRLGKQNDFIIILKTILLLQNAQNIKGGNFHKITID